MGDALAVQRGTYRRMVQRHLGQASSCVSYDRIARLAGPDRAFALFWIVRSTLCRTVTTRPITPEVYEALQHAYQFFNSRVWGGILPELLITLQRRRSAAGFFSARRFSERVQDRHLTAPTRAGLAHELALNPEGFVGRSDRDVVSILVHEMVHAWQQEHGAPSRRGYHNRQWAGEMRRVGLYPSSTSAPGGREVGQRVGHYVVEGGLFATLWQELEAGGFALRWESAEPSAALRRVRAAQRASKTRFRCPGCRANAWARPGTSLLCGRCSRHAVLVRLVDASNSMEHPRDERSVAPSRAYRVRQPSRVG
jgi:hypothetical protein